MNQKVNILLVDDRPEGIVTLEAVLNSPEFNLIKASSGREALAHVLHHDFAVILMDVQMPDMDGFETATLIKQREKSKNIPIIFLTAINKADVYVNRGYTLGGVDYMFKPFDPHILKSKVMVFVELYKKNLIVQEQNEVLRAIERRERLRSLSEIEIEGRRRYQNLADAVPQIVFRANSSGSLDYFNQFWHNYTSKSVTESVNEGWRSSIHPKDLPEVEERWKKAFKDRGHFQCECRIRQGRSGEYRWFLLRVVPEFDKMTSLVGWIGVATDMHDQKMTEQELLLAKRMAEAANETKSRFLANMSHEIRTPLGAILGFSELLVDPKTTEEEKEESITVIRRNGEQLSKIIDEILDLSKVEAGKMEVELADVSVVNLLNGVRTFMSLSAREKGLDLQFLVNGAIPTKILSSATRLQQILVNVIGNGIKFSPKGSLKVTVSFEPSAQDKSSRLRICVQDSGPGLSRDQIQRLFQPFTQVDTSMTRKYGGTGLGLALSRRLARALGGDIEVDESLPGQGCNFQITIATGPLEGVPFVSTLEVRDPHSESASAQKSEALKGVKILLVEDSEDNQVMVSRFLNMEGAQVELANNGLEGVQKALNGQHDLILMDIQMPELDGYGAITRLRKLGYAKPIIALTAHGMVEDRMKCLEVGSNDHLTKPVNRKNLIKSVKHYAENQHLS